MNAPQRPTAFSLVGLTLLDIGPLRGTTTVALIDPHQAKPANLFLIMGPNGSGKTTILDGIYQAMALLEGRTHPEFLVEDLNGPNGGIQLDALVQLDDGVHSKLRLLSIVAGRPGRLRTWSREELSRFDIDTDQIVLHFDRRSPVAPVELQKSSDPEAVAFLEAVMERLGEQPASLFDSTISVPSVLYFPSDRGIQRPPRDGRSIVRPKLLGYRPARRFGVDGDSWAESIENLLVWFTWLDPDLEKSCRETVNDLVFRGTKRLAGVDRQTLAVPVETKSGDRHRVDQLSSGERQLVQLVTRIAAHKTRSTIVLIDETEQHLHTVMRRRLINIVKEWARDLDGLAFVMTSHQAESVRLLAPKLVEEKLYKAGCLVKPPFGSPL